MNKPRSQCQIKHTEIRGFCFEKTVKLSNVKCVIGFGNLGFVFVIFERNYAHQKIKPTKVNNMRNKTSLALSSLSQFPRAGAKTTYLSLNFLRYNTEIIIPNNLIQVVINITVK